MFSFHKPILISLIFLGGLLAFPQKSEGKCSNWAAKCDCILPNKTTLQSSVVVPCWGHVLACQEPSGFTSQVAYHCNLQNATQCKGKCTGGQCYVGCNYKAGD